MRKYYRIFHTAPGGSILTYCFQKPSTNEIYPKTPAEIFRIIDNQSVNRKPGESLIKRYGDHRVREALASLQGETGIELTEETGARLNHIGQLIDEIFEKMIVIYPPPGKKGRK